MKGVEAKEKVIIKDSKEIHIINIKDIDGEFSEVIDKYFVKICEGDSGSKIKIVKKKVRKFLDSKSDETKIGAIAEFFIHLHLNKLNFKQECKFLNLEEGSIKKGFDGYYSKNNEEWIMESKSGFITTKNISHVSKIKVAYEDLDNKIKGDTSNDPWNNAYNHACHRDIGTKESIITHIKKLSDDFEEDKFYNIKDFNIIPGATIFLDGTWIDNNFDEQINKVEKLISKLNYNKIIVICLTKKCMNLFIKFLEK